MPIKFRCPHCKQFLGISRSKAGNVTDCPTCGRTIRVPNLDGEVDPVPKPELNLKDAGLAKALGALASLNSLSDDLSPESGPPRSLTETLDSAEPEASSPALHVAKPVERQVTPLELVQQETVNGHLPGRSPHGPDQGQPHLDPLKSLAEISPASGLSSPAAGSQPDVRRILLFLVPSCLACFALGFVTARGLALQSVTPPVQDVQQPVEAKHPDDLQQPIAPAPPAEKAIVAEGPLTSEDLKQRQIRGKITYLAPGGEIRPDRGARVLLLPAERNGTIKLPAEAFLAGVNDVDQRIGELTLSELGGAIALADEQGTYSAATNSTGPVWVVVISRYQARHDSGGLVGDAKTLLETYFDRPEKIVGKLKYDVQVFPPTADQAIDEHHVEFPL